MSKQLQTVLLLGLLSVIFVASGSLFGQQYLWIFGTLAIGLNIVAYFFSDRVLLALQGAKEVSLEQMPELHRMVEDLAWRAGIPKPKVYVFDSPQPNAFATGRSPANGVVAFSSGILNLLSERELRGVAAHELAHIKNRDILIMSVAGTIASAITYVAEALQWATILGGRSSEEDASPLKTLALAFLGPIAALIVQLAISRSREYLADESGAQIAGDAQGLAYALAKISRYAEQTPPASASPATAHLFIINPFASVGGMLATLFSTHPPVEKRIARLEALAYGPSMLGRAVLA